MYIALEDYDRVFYIYDHFNGSCTCIRLQFLYVRYKVSFVEIKYVLLVETKWKLSACFAMISVYANIINVVYIDYRYVSRNCDDISHID